MKKFYTPVDLRSRADMTAFLGSHFRYPTMNAWNRATSYACNLKVDRLGLNASLVGKLLDMLGTEEFQMSMRSLILDFGEAHSQLWQAGMNGRSGGYLVLYQGYTKPSAYKSYCQCCGQGNFKSTAESGTVCGRCGSPSRVDYEKAPLEIGVYPGRGTDDGEDYENWTLDELRSRVRLVQEFDQLADAMVERGMELARRCSVEEEEYFVPRTRKVLIPSA